MAEDEMIHGLQALLLKMDSLPLVMQKTLIVRALQKGAEPIEEQASQLAPDDATTPGSRIRDNMMTTITDRTADGAIAKIGPSLKGFVGLFHEYGTIHQAAKPFLRPAFDGMQGDALTIISEVLTQGIEQELKK